jgi:hypothetical protein
MRKLQEGESSDGCSWLESLAAYVCCVCLLRIRASRLTLSSGKRSGELRQEISESFNATVAQTLVSERIADN